MAGYFDPDDEVAHGVSKLEALLDYLKASGGVPLARAKIHLGRQTVRVPAAGKAQTNKKDFAATSVEELRQATRAAKSARLSSIGVAYRQQKLFLSSIDPSSLRLLAKVLGSLKLQEA